MSRNNSLKRGSASSIPGIITSCCPFLSTSEKEGHGSPPYSKDLRLRIHNWSNSLSGPSQIPKNVFPSTKEMPGLPEFSKDNSISFQKSDTSLDMLESNDFTVILEARDSLTNQDRSFDIIDNNLETQLEDDWQAEKGQEEEEVIVMHQLNNDMSEEENNPLVLEAKEASTALLEKREQHSPVPCSPPQSSGTTPSSLTQHLFEICPADETKKIETLSTPDEPKPRRITSSLEMFDALAYPSPPTPQEPFQHSSSTELLDINIRAEAEALHDLRQNEQEQDSKNINCSPPNEHQTEPNYTQTVESSQTSASSELVCAISKLRPSRGSKCRRSRMTSIRAPTPWSDAGPEDAADEHAELERAPSSTGTSSYSSVEALADSNSFHTLPTTSSSAECADASDAADPAMAEAAGDRPPPSQQGDDGFSLRYFCGAFRPDDHEMSRHAGLEEVSVAELIDGSRPRVTPFHSDSAVGRSPEEGQQRRRGGGSVSDIVLPVGVRASVADTQLPSADSSGVQLEAKPPSTCLPP